MSLIIMTNLELRDKLKNSQSRCLIVARKTILLFQL